MADVNKSMVFKLVTGILGVIAILTGISYVNATVGSIILPVFLIGMGIVMGLQVGIKSLLNNKFDKSDIIDVFELVLALVNITGALILLRFIPIEESATSVIVSGIALTLSGLWIMVQSFRNWER